MSYYQGIVSGGECSFSLAIQGREFYFRERTIIPKVACMCSIVSAFCFIPLAKSWKLSRLGVGYSWARGIFFPHLILAFLWHYSFGPFPICCCKSLQKSLLTLFSSGWFFSSSDIQFCKFDIRLVISRNTWNDKRLNVCLKFQGSEWMACLIHHVSGCYHGRT